MITAARQVAASRTLWIGLALIFGYWPVAWVVPTNPQIETEHAIRFVIGTAATIIYLPGLVAALRAPVPSYGNQLVLGICLALFGGAGVSCWLIVWRLAGRPEWMIQANINGWFLWLQILGIVLHLTAKRIGPSQGLPPRTNWRVLGLTAIATVALVAVVVHVRPDLRAFAEWLRPYFDDGS